MTISPQSIKVVISHPELWSPDVGEINNYILTRSVISPINPSLIHLLPPALSLGVLLRPPPKSPCILRAIASLITITGFYRSIGSAISHGEIRLNKPPTDTKWRVDGWRGGGISAAWVAVY